MADVAVSGTGKVEYLTLGTALALPAGQSVGTGDVAVLTPAAGKPFRGDELLLMVKESGSTTDATFTVKAGVSPAKDAVLGDAATSAAFADGATKLIQVSLARYLQANGTVRIAVGGGAGAALTFTAVVLDRRA
jgi:hypothetical protein